MPRILRRRLILVRSIFTGRNWQRIWMKYVKTVRFTCFVIPVRRVKKSQKSWQNRDMKSTASKMAIVHGLRWSSAKWWLITMQRNSVQRTLNEALSRNSANLSGDGLRRQSENMNWCRMVIKLQSAFLVEKIPCWWQSCFRSFHVMEKRILKLSFL